MQNVRIDIGTVWPDDSAEFGVDGDCAERIIVTLASSSLQWVNRTQGLMTCCPLPDRS